MRTIKTYRPPGRPPPFYDFLAALEGKLRAKLLRQIAAVAAAPLSGLKEPHVKHFSIERYSDFYEIREKHRVLVRVIFTITDGELLLLASFVKWQPRDTMRALELSERMLAEVREYPERAVPFILPAARKEAG